MKQPRKINNALFSSLDSNISDPFIVIDHNGDILSLNKKAEILFSIETPLKNIFNLFDEQSIGKLSDLIEKVFSYNNGVSENIHLVLRDGVEINVQAIINSYKEENEIFIFCTFRKQEFKLELEDVTNLKMQGIELNNIIANRSILGIIEKIKSLYPFTFIGKEKILKEINQLEEMFWLKDNNGFYVLANHKLAESLGLKSTQIEGKPANSFIPAYLLDFYISIEKYISETLNCTIIDGVPFIGVGDTKKYQTIEVPLSDTDNNVIAIVGIAQLKEVPNENKIVKESIGSLSNLLDNFPLAIAIIDNEGIIKHESKEFSKLFSVENSNLRNFNYSKILPHDLIDRINHFIESSDDVEKFEIEIQLDLGKSKSDNYEIVLSKTTGNQNKFEGLVILIKNAFNNDNLEKIINSRGRMFEILIQNNPEPIFIYDTENLRFIEVNNAALNLYGYRKDEFLQMDLTDLYTPEDIQTLLDSSNLASKAGKFTGPYKHKKKDGSYIFVELSKISFKYQEKDAHFNIIKDVTHNLQLEMKTQLFKSAFENTDDLLLVTDNIGLITFMKSSVKQVLGYSNDEIENTSFNALVKNDDRGTINSSIFQSYLKEPVTISTELKKRNGEFIEVELTAYPILNYKGEAEEFSIICKLVNIPVKTEVKLKEVIKEVYIQHPSSDEEKKAVHFEDDFLPNLFHEILTPINVILGFVQEITESISAPTSDQKEAVDIINQNRSMLLNIMNSVIEYSSIKEQKYELKPEEISITEIIDLIHNDFKEIIGTKNIEFAYGKISSSLKFTSDRLRFQNLISLLMRLIAHMNKEKKIYFSAYQNDDETFIISIKDNYSNVSKQMMKKIRDIFEQEANGFPKEIGISKLSIRSVKALLTLLKGKFQILPQPSEKLDYGFIFPIDISIIEENEVAVEGTNQEIGEERFVKTVEEVKGGFPDIEYNPINSKIIIEPEIIPIEEEKGKFVESKKELSNIKPFTKTNERLDLSSLTCLYIEDQIDSQILFKVQMKELNEIKFAVSFEEALPLLNNHHFDFIVMDINLQGEYNGLDALRIIHKMPNYENIPIIAVTAYVLPGDKEKFIATGFSDFISKPIFREKMIDSLEKIFLLHV